MYKHIILKMGTVEFCGITHIFILTFDTKDLLFI